MWALRRASISVRCQGYCLGAARSLFATPDVLHDKLHRVSREHDHLGAIRPLVGGGFFCMPPFPGDVTMGTRSLSSQVGTKSSDEEDDLDDGFSELETPSETNGTLKDTISVDDTEDLISEPEVSDDEAEGDVVDTTRSGLEVADTEVGPSANKEMRRKISTLVKVVYDAPRQGLSKALDKWVEEGNSLSRTEYSLTMLKLRKFKVFQKALQLTEWVEANKCFDLTERDYAGRLDLIAKVHGLSSAEKYIGNVPKSFQGEVVYRTLLANSTTMLNFKKAEEIFNKMKDLGFPLTTFSCNQLLILYKKLDKKKVADVLLMMEKENVKPSLFTYKLLIDIKGQACDIEGMEQVLETMKAEGIEPDLSIQSLLAKHYIYGGSREKAEDILKEMEGGNLKENRGACVHLLSLYASLHDSENVSRIWRECEASPRWAEGIAAMEAWGRLGKVDKAEAVFEKVEKTLKSSSKYYTILLKVYANNKLFVKGKDLVKKMLDKGVKMGPFTWDSLVKLYLEAGEIEKADSILHKAVQQNSNKKPFYTSYLAILSQYAKRGDVHNAEKIFHRLREAGYVGRIQQYEALLQAYVNSKTPAYGFRERMKADKIFPNKNIASMLVQVDAFMTGSVYDLLD